MSEQNEFPTIVNLPELTDENLELTTIVNDEPPAFSDEIEQAGRTAAEEEALLNGLQVKSAVHAFRAGKSLHFIRDNLKAENSWCYWQSKNNWNKGTALRRINLYLGAKTEDALEGLTITEAEQKFCSKPKTRANSEKPSEKQSAADTSLHSPLEIAREAAQSMLEHLSEMSKGERQIDDEVLSHVKKLWEMAGEIISELEAR